MLPVLFKIGTFEVHSYGVMMVVAFVAAIAIAQVRAPRYGLKKSEVGDLCFWCLLFGVIGARVVFIIQDLPYYLTHWRTELLTLEFRGLTSFGGLLFGMAAAIVWAIKRRIPVLTILDLAAPAYIVGAAIGRFGCLLNGCCFGDACPPNLPWGIHVEGSQVLHHPAQVYDALMNFAVLGYLLYRERKGLNVGQLAGLALALHGTARVIYEFWREGTPLQVAAGEASSTYWGRLPFTQAQAMAGALVVAGTAMYWIFRRRTAEPPRSGPSADEESAHLGTSSGGDLRPRTAAL